MSGKTRTRSNAQQLKLLTDFMATHPKLAHGEFSGPLGRRIENKQWEDLRAMLSEHGPDKSIEQWKVTWRDLRRKARTIGSVAKEAANSTGNATVVPALTERTVKILGIMGTEGPFGIQGGEESSIGSTPALSGTPTPVQSEEEIELSFIDENESSNTTLHHKTFSEVTAQDTYQRAVPIRKANMNEREQYQRQPDARASVNQFLEAEFQNNNILMDIAKQLAIANRHSAIRSRLTYKEKLWRLRQDLFK